jgi:hypothetical protein
MYFDPRNLQTAAQVLPAASLEHRKARYRFPLKSTKCFFHGVVMIRRDLLPSNR